MTKWITIPALLIAGGASAVATNIYMIEAEEEYGAPYALGGNPRLAFAVMATGPFGLVFAICRYYYYSTRPR